MKYAINEVMRQLHDYVTGLRFAQYARNKTLEISFNLTSGVAPEKAVMRDGGVVRIQRTASAARIAEVCGVDGVVETERAETPDERIMRKIGARNVGRPLETEGANPRYYDGQEWRVNCQRCVPTWEARRRGWDVTAKPKPSVRDTWWDSKYGWDYPHIRFLAFEGAEPFRYRSRWDIERKMKEWGDGARAQIVCKWKGKKGGAHTFVAEQRNGKTYFICPQSNNEGYDPFRRISFSSMFSRDTNVFARIDNLQFSERIKMACEPTNPQE